MIRCKDFRISGNEKKCLREKASMDVQIFNSYLEFVKKYFGDRKNIRILDIGCGIYKQVPILFQSYGFAANGIDNYQNVPLKYKLSDLVQPFLKKRYYYKALRNETGRRLKIKNTDIKNCDAVSMPFPDANFNVVFSSAVFEHISDVPGVVSELSRVLMHGGRARIGIHLFPSLTGCHNPQMWEIPVTKMPEDLAPWYHVRGLPGFILEDLNRYREHQYRKCFRDFFEIEEEIYPDYTEGEHLLTDNIIAELKDYTREELLRRWIVFVLRKK